MTPEEEVVVLRAELHKFMEAFTELTYRYTTLHNFMILQFGDKFKKYVLEETGEDLDQDDELNEGEELEGGNSLWGNSSYGEEEEAEEQDEGHSPATTSSTTPKVIELQSVSQIKAAVQQITGNGNGSNSNASNVTTQKPGRNANGPPPLLMKRPLAIAKRPGLRPPPATITPIRGGGLVHSGNKGNQVLLSNDDEDFRAGKYSKFYKPVNSELIQCKMCNKILKRRGKFIQHLRTHTGEKPFTCDYCPASFSRKDNMGVHVAKHHAGQQIKGSSSAYEYQCQLCPKQFGNERIFKAHYQLVHGCNMEEDGEDDEYNSLERDMTDEMMAEYEEDQE